MTGINDLIQAEQRRLESVLRAAYDAGKADAKREMLMVLSGEAQYSVSAFDSGHEIEDRKRAPRGLPRKLATRVLFDNFVLGDISPQDICDAAITEYEKMIAPSSIRGELRNGKEPKDGKEPRYQEDKHGWKLTKTFYETVEARLAARDADPYR